jgi:DNA-binding HxlR family transcriptional regulator
MRDTIFGSMQCSLARALDVVGDGWALLILRDLYAGVRRFDQLADDLGVSRNLLTARLRQLVDDGVVVRNAYSSKPPRYEYELSEAGRDLVPAILTLTAWGDKWLAPSEGSPILFRHDPCGHIIKPEIVCPCCRAKLKAGDVTLLPGPGGQRRRGTMLIAEMLGDSKDI